MRFFKTEGVHRALLFFIFSIKVVAGCVLFWIYSHHYVDRSTSDVFRYYDDAQIMFSSFNESPLSYFKMLTGIQGSDPELNVYYDKMMNWNLGKSYNFYNDNRTITRFNALVMLFSFGNYHLHTLIMCFLSLIGLVAIYKFILFFSEPDGWIFISIFFLPSVLFWTSGVLKEGLVVFGMGGLLWNAARLIKEKFSIWILLTSVLFFLFLLLVKVYVLVAMIPPLIAFLWTAKNNRGVGWKYPVTLVTCFATGFFIFKMYLGIDPIHVVAEKQNDFFLLARGGTYLVEMKSKDTIYIPLQGKENIKLVSNPDHTCSPISNTSGFLWKQKLEAGVVTCGKDQKFELLLNLTYTGSKIETSRMKPTWSSLFKKIPEAVFNVLFRPFIWEGGGAFSLLAALENLLILFFIGFSVVRRAKGERRNWNMIIFCLSFFLLLAVLIGVITPVAGALVRYKVPALPFLLIAFALLMQGQKKEIHNKV